MCRRGKESQEWKNSDGNTLKIKKGSEYIRFIDLEGF
jgi:hypothetical protein